MHLSMTINMGLTSKFTKFTASITTISLGRQGEKLAVCREGRNVRDSYANLVAITPFCSGKKEECGKKMTWNSGFPTCSREKGGPECSRKKKSWILHTFHRLCGGKDPVAATPTGQSNLQPSSAQPTKEHLVVWVPNSVTRTTEKASALCSALLYSPVSPNQICRLAQHTHTAVKMHHSLWLAL